MRGEGWLLAYCLMGQNWGLIETESKTQFLKCMCIMQADLCHPYNILSTTVLSDHVLQLSACVLYIA